MGDETARKQFVAWWNSEEAIRESHRADPEWVARAAWDAALREAARINCPYCAANVPLDLNIVPGTYMHVEGGNGSECQSGSILALRGGEGA